MAMGKLVCEVRVGGEDVIKVLTTAQNTNVGQFVKTMPGVGKKFFWWPSIQAGTVIAADFTDAPTVSGNTEENNAALEAITVAPSEVLTFA